MESWALSDVEINFYDVLKDKMMLLPNPMAREYVDKNVAKINFILENQSNFPNQNCDENKFFLGPLNKSSILNLRKENFGLHDKMTIILEILL